MSLIVQCDFEVSNSTFSKYSFGRDGVTKKEYSVYALDNVDNSGRPLNETRHPYKGLLTKAM